MAIPDDAFKATAPTGQVGTTVFRPGEIGQEEKSGTFADTGRDSQTQRVETTSTTVSPDKPVLKPDSAFDPLTSDDKAPFAEELSNQDSGKPTAERVTTTNDQGVKTKESQPDVDPNATSTGSDTENGGMDDGRQMSDADARSRIVQGGIALAVIFGVLRLMTAIT